MRTYVGRWPGGGQNLCMSTDSESLHNSSEPVVPLGHAAACTLVPRYVSDMVGAVEGASLSLPVPTCPGWDLGKLVRHVGTVYRWAGRIVETEAEERLDVRTLDLKFPAGPSNGWAEWLRDSGVVICDALDESTSGTAIWAWGGDQRADFWSRRMVHETAVHLADVLVATGALGPGWYPGSARIAADGIDEFLTNLPYSAAAARGPGLPSNGTIHLHATDADTVAGVHPAEWTIDLGPDGFVWGHEHRKGDVAVRGTIEDLLLFVYGRFGPEFDLLGEPRVEVFGDRDLLGAWLAGGPI
jgi:uncharacterized protein (TIGR03083 family)